MSYQKGYCSKQPLFQLSECKRKKTFEANIYNESDFDGICSCEKGYVGAKLKCFEYTPDAERLGPCVPMGNPSNKGPCKCPQKTQYYTDTMTCSNITPQTAIKCDQSRNPCYYGI